MNAWCSLKGHKYLNLQLKAAGFFKYIWPSGHQVWREINTFSTLTHIRSWIDSYRHQSTDLRCKSTDWFLYKYNISLISVNEVFYCCCSLRYHSFSTHANFFEKQYFSPPNAHTYVCLSGGWGWGRNVSLSKNFVYLLNERSLIVGSITRKIPQNLPSNSTH